MGTELGQQNIRNGLIRYSSLAIAGAVSVLVLLLNPGQVHAGAPITPSGLHTQVDLSATSPGGTTQYDITGGTRPGGVSGTNLFHSFNDFGVPLNNIANFQNGVSFNLAGNPLPANLTTSNILARVTGDFRSDIFGTIQTSGFGNANLFLMNPHGFLIGPNATVNVGGMVSFSSADYLRLTDGARFNAVPNAAADALLSTQPVAAFGFLGPNFGAITIETTQLALKEGQGITLVGGDITIDGGFSSGGIVAPNGRIEIASVASPGEVVRTPQGLSVDALGQLGTVSLTNNAVVQVGDFNGTGVGTIRIRGGRFVMDHSLIGADNFGDVDASPVGIDIGVRNDVVLQNISFISSTTQRGQAHASDIRITANSVLVDNFSTISSSSIDGPGHAGNITLTVDQLAITGGGEILAGASGPGQAGSITINGAESVTVSGNFGGDPTLPSLITSQSQSPTEDAGNISITTPSLVIMDGARVEANSFAAGRGGDVVLNVHNLTMSGGAQIKTSSQPFFVSPEAPAGAGDIHVNATETISLSGASTGLFSETSGAGPAGSIAMHANAVTLNNGSQVTSSSTGSGNAGNIQINAGNQFVMTNSSVTTEANQASGGTIKITTTPSGTVQLTNSTISASVLDGTGGGGSVDIDPLYVILLNSHILAKAVEGPGGNITINISNGGLFLPDANSTVSASSQFGVNGTVTIQSPNAPASGKIQPLGKSPLQATSLLNQHCAALAGGEFSSFTVAGRDSLPTEPGSWLTSPLATLSAGTTPGTCRRQARLRSCHCARSRRPGS